MQIIQKISGFKPSQHRVIDGGQYGNIHSIGHDKEGSAPIMV